MQNSALHFIKTDSADNADFIAVSLLPRLVEEWLADGQIRQNSPRTLDLRRVLLGRFLWFLEERQHSHCSPLAVRAFFAYLSMDHEDAGGRWGKGDGEQFTGQLRPATIATYFRHLRAFFAWLVGEEYVAASPMARLSPPVVRADQVQPFTPDQVKSLLQACQRGKYARRNEAVIRFLLDTGLRASELCQLKMRDLDLLEGQVRVLGKGNKYRTVCFGRRTTRSVRNYLREDERENPDEALFLSERDGQALTRSGLGQLIERLGNAAGIHTVRCSPHTFRHTFAVEFLRNGGNVFSLKEILGHTSLHMTNRYVALAQADIQSQHRRFSPGDRLGV